MLQKKLQKGIKHFRVVSQGRHKSYVVILFEILYWILFRKGRFSYYMDYNLYLKKESLADFVAPGEFHRIEKKLNTPEYYPILEDKYFFYKILEGNGFRSPKNLYLIEPSGIYMLDSGRYIDENEFLEGDLNGFCKVINGYGGSGVFPFEISNREILVRKETVTFPDFLKMLGSNKYLIQERIVQHPEMNALNPSCINTIRILTMRTGNTVHLFEDYLRIGINNSYVDNGMSGNIMIGIGEAGKLMNEAWSTGKDDPIHTLKKHPQTGVRFEDFTIPFYQESVVMAKSLHQLYQQFFMIGWDICITPEGPLVIEGNNITNLFPFQVLYGGKRRAFKEMAESYEKQLGL